MLLLARPIDAERALRLGLINEVVPGEQLMEANALSTATQNLMPMLGLALSGSVLGLLYKLYPATFFPSAALANAASFFFSGYCIARLPSLRPKRSEASRAGPATPGYPQ